MGAITFTPSDTDGPTGTDTGVILNWSEPSTDQNAIVEPIPGWGVGVKYIGEGRPQFFTAELKVNEASQNAQRTEVDAWESLKGGKGALDITQQNYSQSYTNMVLVDVETTYNVDLLTLITLRFVQGTA